MSDILGPEQQLQDALYCLQRGRELGGFEAELAFVGGEFLENSSVFTDLKTGNRLVVSELPDNPNDFEGATVLLSHSSGRVRVNIGGIAVSAREIVATIDDSMATSVLLKGDRDEISLSPDITDILPLLQFPHINPVPMAESDIRETPPQSPYSAKQSPHHDPYGVLIDHDRLPVPRNRAYVRLADYFDRTTPPGEQEPVIQEIDLFGVTEHNAQVVPFDLNVSEIATTDDERRITDFDRTFYARLSFPKGSGLELTANFPGYENPVGYRAESFKLRVLRDGIVMVVDWHYGDRRVRPLSCSPTPETLKLIEDIVEYGQLQ